MEINTRVVCELVGDDVVVLDPQSSAVVRVSGAGAAVVKRLLAGERVSDQEPGVDELLARGVVVSRSPKRVSRRSLVVGGVSVGAAGLLTLGLPAVAQASSMSLPLPRFALSIGEDGSYWDDVDNQKVKVYWIQIVKEDFVNADEFPAGFTLEWSFSSSFADPVQFSEDEGWYQWLVSNDESLGIPADSLSGTDLTVFVRVRSTSLVSPVVELLLPEE